MLNLRIDNAIAKEAYDRLIKEIKTNEEFPDRFYEMYGFVTGFSKKSTTNRYLIYDLLNERKICPCVDLGFRIAYGVTENYRLLGVNKITVALALDKDVSPKRCLDFYLSDFDYLYNTIGIKNASQFYYQKDIEQLSDDEMLELAVMALNPSLYNKKEIRKG